MEIAVVGAGCVGLTTAFRLAQRGAKVTVFDASDQVGSGASFSNGGQLSYSFADGLAEPGLFKRLPAILLDRDPAIRARLLLTPPLWPWGLRFLASCLPARSARNSAALLELALRSAAVSERLHTDLGDRYGYRKAGKLVLLNEPASDELTAQIARKHAAGCDITLLDAEQTLCCEPVIANLRRRPAGAIYGASDAVGDARRYCVTIASELERYGGKLELGTPVSSLIQRRGTVTGLRTSGGEASFDAVVLCTGGQTNDLTAPLGLKLPIVPVTGYSLTLPPPVEKDSERELNRSLTLRDAKVVFSRLGNAIRIAGMADINLPSDQRPARLNTLMQIARSEAPDLARYPDDAAWRAILQQHQATGFEASPDSPVWVGHRPMTPSGLPIVGATHLAGLFLNAGHGMLGWTLGAATSEALALQLTGGSQLTAA